MSELKPCPFCGAGTFEVRPNGRMWLGMKYSEPASVSVLHWCEATPGQPSRVIERVGRDEASAIEAWNRRAQPAQAVPPDVVRDADLALDLLAKIFDAYENGTACYEDPDEYAGYIGNAVQLDDDTFHACAELLNRRRPIAAMAQGEKP